MNHESWIKILLMKFYKNYDYINDTIWKWLFQFFFNKKIISFKK